ncbi:unnamed protein product [Symbiodinium necroappetens]|uniref:Uncharacterized protein n=1 Tax=Symbiodinium necroappetens TaxID=1628268 RepID=A0A812L9C4_9DINO|nr:unnamed protein product [Symbiodinium necroappetens]
MPDLTAFSNLFQTLDVLRSKTEPDTDTQTVSKEEIVQPVADSLGKVLEKRTKTAPARPRWQRNTASGGFEEDSPPGAMEDSAEQNAEELQLEAEIRMIELDIAALDKKEAQRRARAALRDELEAQEQLLEAWQASLAELRRERHEAEAEYLFATKEDRREEARLKADFDEAKRRTEALRARLERLDNLEADGEDSEDLAASLKAEGIG